MTTNPPSIAHALLAADMERFFNAARDGDAIAIRDGLRLGMPVDAATPKVGSTMLMLASWYGHVAAAHYLLGQGADPMHRNLAGQSVLQYASRCRRMLVRLLETEARRDVNHADMNGFTPLLTASNILGDATPHGIPNHSLVPGRILCIDALVAAGADVNAQDCMGRTALMKAAYAGSSSLIECLRGHGAREDLRCNRGWTAADWVPRFAHSARSVLAPRAEEDATEAALDVPH